MEDGLVLQLPELDEIQDQGLRGQVMGVYREALARGKWEVEDLGRIPFTLLLDPCPVTYAEHVRGVTRTALAMARTMTSVYGDRLAVNRDILAAGALLHDVGKLVEYRRRGPGGYGKSETGRMLRHPFSGAALCYAAGLPDAVTHCVAVHAHEGDGARASVEAILINHADFANFEPFKLK